MHLIHNIEYTWTSDTTATVRAAFVAPMSTNLLPFEYGPLMTCAGWYHHELKRDAQGVCG